MSFTPILGRTAATRTNRFLRSKNAFNYNPSYIRSRALTDYASALRWLKSMSPKKMEEEHKFIQIVFPTSKRSSVVPDAPILSAEDIGYLQSSHIKEVQKLRESQLEAFQILGKKHFGIDAYADGIFISNPELLHEKLSPGNHNNARVSRILRSLNEFGNTEQAEQFMLLLEREFRPRPEMHDSLKQWWFHYEDSLQENTSFVRDSGRGRSSSTSSGRTLVDTPAGLNQSSGRSRSASVSSPRIRHDYAYFDTRADKLPPGKIRDAYNLAFQKMNDMKRGKDKSGTHDALFKHLQRWEPLPAYPPGESPRITIRPEGSVIPGYVDKLPPQVRDKYSKALFAWDHYNRTMVNPNYSMERSQDEVLDDLVEHIRSGGETAELPRAFSGRRSGASSESTLVDTLGTYPSSVRSRRSSNASGRDYSSFDVNPGAVYYAPVSKAAKRAPHTFNRNVPEDMQDLYDSFFKAAGKFPGANYKTSHAYASASLGIAPPGASSVRAARDAGPTYRPSASVGAPAYKEAVQNGPYPFTKEDFREPHFKQIYDSTYWDHINWGQAKPEAAHFWALNQLPSRPLNTGGSRYHALRQMMSESESDYRSSLE